MTKLVINLPFAGFYESRYSGEIDGCEESDAENFAEEDRGNQPEELRLTADQFAEILFDCADYSAAYDTIARDYVFAFDVWAAELLEMRLGLKLESMDSPREYNFSTDRVYASVDSAVIDSLFARSAADGHATLAKCIADRFTSYDGFISHYDNRLDDWLTKPVGDWDHNELCTLLMAALILAGAEKEWEWEVFELIADDSGFFQAWSSCVDWPKFEERVAEIRAKRIEEQRAIDPDYVPPYRCPETPDLFPRI